MGLADAVFLYNLMKKWNVQFFVYSQGFINATLIWNERSIYIDRYLIIPVLITAISCISVFIKLFLMKTFCLSWYLTKLNSLKTECIIEHFMVLNSFLFVFELIGYFFNSSRWAAKAEIFYFIWAIKVYLKKRYIEIFLLHLCRGLKR